MSSFLCEQEPYPKAIPKASLAGCTVLVHQHLDETLRLTYGPRRLGRCGSQGTPVVTSTEAAAG